MAEKMSGLLDCHTHSLHSFDGSESVSNMIERALQLELTVYCITDHCEMNDHNLSKIIAEIRATVNQTDALKSVTLQKGLTLLSGIELGQPLQALNETEALLDDLKLDYVIGSLHNIKGEQDFYYLSYTEENIPQYLTRYFDEVYEMVCWGKFDSLGHLTYPLRYMEGKLGTAVDLAPYEGQIERILKELVKRGIGLEINTSGLRTGIGNTYPPFAYIKRFYELGGRYLTLGSDAHRTADIGAGIETAVKLAEKAGFKQLTYFVGRQPQFLSI